MAYEYKQVRYRASEGRFDGNLNKMAVEGWKVESIDRVDDLFLVTYGREKAGPFKTDECAANNLDRVLEVNRRAGNRLVSIVGATQRPNNDFIYTVVWEIVDQTARQQSFTLY